MTNLRDPAEATGDSGDQAQELQSAMEREAIAAALAGHPHGEFVEDRDGLIVDLEGEDPEAGLTGGDSSDDPTYGGGDITGQEPTEPGEDR
jgi:hypothetical protein